MCTNKSHLTAIPRRQLSKPMQWLVSHDLLCGKTLLDYGCGRGTDVTLLNMSNRTRCIATGYDPYYFPVKPDAQFEVVLNVIPDEVERRDILYKGLEYLKAGGRMYAAIRADKANLKGWTKRGTWQGFVADTLEHEGFELIHRSQFQIWVMYQ